MMLNRKIHLLIPVILLIFSNCSKSEVNIPVKKEVIDGVVHLMNPELPLKGHITLEITKIRELNPYDTEEFGLGWIDFKRDSDGEVMLYYSTGSEVHRFSSENTYLGNLTRQGQGPGEFSDGQFLNPFYVNNQIYVTGGRKLSRFEKNGNLFDERKTGQNPMIFVDENRFFVLKSEGLGDGWNVKILLMNMTSETIENFNETIFFQKENVGRIEEKGGNAGYSHPWGIPDILYSFDSFNQRMFVCLNTEYKIYAKNLSGETEYVVERPYKKVNITEGDKKKILTSYFQREPDKWMVDSFPDTLVSIKNIKSLPNGYLAVYRVVGINKYEIDIFNPDGHYIYSASPLEDIALDVVKFYGFGFARIKTKDDGFMVYEEYAIQNLPEIFGNPRFGSGGIY